MYDEGITPGELCLQLLTAGKRYFPDFYRSDLQAEFDRIWNFQKQFYPDSLIDKVKDEVRGKNKSQTWAILAKYFVWKEVENSWNEEEAQTRRVEKNTDLWELKGSKERGIET